MASSSRHDIVLVRYPFSDLSGAKVRPAVVVSAAHPSQDLLITPLTSRTTGLLPGEFVLAEWRASGLNVATAAKRGVYTIHQSLVAKKIGVLRPADGKQLDQALAAWLGI
jgi:mRNA interferase MazF